MPETYTTPFVATTNAVIASSDHNASYGGNIRYFRQFLTNPDNANQILQSTGADGADWVNRATVVLDAIGFTPPNADTQIVTTFAAALVANGSGFFEVSPATDGPTGSGAWYLLNLCEGNAPTTYALQVTCNINDQDAMYTRNVIGGVAGTWRRIWHDGNVMAPKTATQSGTLALTTSWSDASGLSVTLNRNGKWLVHLQCDLFRSPAGSDTYPQARLVQGSSTQIGTPAINNALDALLTVPVVAVATVSGGSDTVKVQGKKDTGTGFSELGNGELFATWHSP